MEVDNNKITQSIIIGTATLLSALSWATLESLFYNSGFWLWPILSFFGLTVFLSIIWLLTSSRVVLYITLFFILITFFFNFGVEWQYLILMPLAMGFFILGSYLAIREGQVRIKICVVSILKKGLPLIFTGISLLIVGAYYFSPMAVKAGEEIKISRPFFNAISKPLILTFKNQNLNIGGEKFKIPEGQISNEAIQEKLYLATNQYLNRLKETYEQYIPLGLAFGIFLALKTLSIPFMWLTILMSLLIFRILVWRGAIMIQEQTTLKEVIEV